MMERSVLEKVFVSKAHARVLEYFLDHPGESFRQNRIIKDTGLSISRVRRVLINLVLMNLVAMNKVVGELCQYNLIKNSRTELLTEFLRNLRMEED